MTNIENNLKNINKINMINIFISILSKTKNNVKGQLSILFYLFV